MSDRGETQEAVIVYVLAAKFAPQQLRIAVRAPFGHHTWMIQETVLIVPRKFGVLYNFRTSSRWNF